jgi:hypothetical protein
LIHVKHVSAERMSGDWWRQAQDAALAYAEGNIGKFHETVMRRGVWGTAFLA